MQDIKNISLKDEYQLHLKEMELNSLLEVTKSINENTSVSDLLRIYSFILKAQMNVQSLVVFHIDDNDWKLLWQDGFDESTLNQVEVEKDLAGFGNAGLFHGTDLHYENDFDYIIPVVHKDKGLAYVLMNGITDDIQNMEDQLKFIITVTNIIIVAIENKRLFNKQLEQERLAKEMELAQQVQQMLIPELQSSDPNFDIDAVYEPHFEVGGDYYDHIQLSKHEHLMCVADVSGKGISASLLMSNFQAQLRAFVKHTTGLRTLVKQLNQSIFSITQGNRFLTLIIAKLNTKTGYFTYINAGHPPCLIANKGSVLYLDKGTTILGAFETLPFLQQQSKQFKGRFTALMFTDGLTDIENDLGEYYPEHRLEEFMLQDNGNYSAKTLNQKIFNDLNEYRGNIASPDDVTILSVTANCPT